MKAIAIFAGLMIVIAVMFGTMGSPSYSDSSGTAWFFNGNTIFDSWDYDSAQETERTRIEAQAAIDRTRIEQEEATRRNADFWRQFPLTVAALALCIMAIAAGILAWRWRPATGPRQVIVNNYHAQLQHYAERIGIPDAEYHYDGAQWLIVDPVSQQAYAPPRRLAMLPGPDS